jgi:hypothetical protein
MTRATATRNRDWWGDRARLDGAVRWREPAAPGLAKVADSTA